MIKLFRMNEYDIYMGHDLESCKEEYLKDTGLEEDEAFDEPHELTEESYAGWTFDNEHGEIDYMPKDSISFSDAIKLTIEKDDRDYPFMFSSTEY